MYNRRSRFSTKTQVWDGLVRIFHWALLLLITLSYYTAQAGFQHIHATLGYFILALLLVRIVWGFVGSEYARFSNFVYSPRIIFDYLKSVVQGHARSYLGHTPAGGAMILVMFAVLATIGLTGLVILATIEFQGPLLGLQIPDTWAYATYWVHTTSVNVLLGLIALHIAGAITASLQTHENLIWSMISGNKKSAERGSTSHVNQ